jgi:transposase-like protein
MPASNPPKAGPAAEPATPGIFIPVTNLIESINARLRKVTRNRGQFPSEQAALKVLYLAVRNLEEFRTPTTGIRSSGWKQALQAFTIYFDGRIPTP